MKKKLIEVALPLDAINIACAREKSIRHGHPSTLHLWWARRPLAAARAVIFAQMVDDPSGYTDVLLSDPVKKRKAEKELKTRLAIWKEKASETGSIEPKPTIEDTIADQERQRLFEIIEDLVLWENTTIEEVLQRARDEIWQSWRRTCAERADHPQARELFDRHKLPAFHDPFAGGGALPLEAQRLGLESYASDLNPVAVLINKAMIEIPPKFTGRQPVNPEWCRKSSSERSLTKWRGAQGLAEDVRYYGKWMRDEAERRIGHLYPKVEITPEMVQERPDLEPYLGRSLTVIAWLWARTVKSPNPAFNDVDVPLASTFMLSTKKGKEAYVEPVIVGGGYRFTVKAGRPVDEENVNKGTKLARANFHCLLSKSPISGDYIKAEGMAGRLNARMMAIVAEGDRERVYLAPTMIHEQKAQESMPTWRPEGEIAKRMTGGNCTPYGLVSWGDLFTPRQLVALTTFSDLVGEARVQIRRDALVASLLDDDLPLRDGGTGAFAYADAVAVYLAFAVSKMTNIGSSIATWMSDRGAFRETFARQAIPMTWDFAEANTFADMGGSFSIAIVKGTMAIDVFPADSLAIAAQIDAASQTISIDKVVSTDPPYYDNIGYADLSDFFYVWLRRSLRQTFPDLFATMAVPKAEELVATPYRHGSKEKAESFFLLGMTKAMQRLAKQSHPEFPVTIYYAFKQSETKDDTGTSSTGWETFLDAVIRAGFAISGTWPVRTEGSGRIIAKGTNALASSIVLVCRKRSIALSTATRREFVARLQDELPKALIHLQRGNIAPVDLAQAAIGPGMAVFTRYENVLDAEGRPLTVREALTLINQTLDETLAKQEGDFDADSRWAITWFEQHGFGEGEYGIAETLSKARNTSVTGLAAAGIVAAKGGKVRLLKPAELPDGWDPLTDSRLTAWETVHQLIRALDSGGDQLAAVLVRKLGSTAEIARELCYRLYTICERKKRAAEALSYNGLVQSFPEIIRLAGEQQETEGKKPKQKNMF